MMDGGMHEGSPDGNPVHVCTSSRYLPQQQVQVPGYRYLGPDNGMTPDLSVIFSNWNCMVFFVWHLKRCGCLFILVANRRDIAAIQIVFGQNATITDFLKLSTLLTFWRNLRKRAFILGLVSWVLFEPAQITDHKYFLSTH